MSVALVTGSAGLIGGQSVRLFAEKGFDVAGVDNDMRRAFFGPDASTLWHRQELERSVKNYVHFDTDIRDRDAMAKVFARYAKNIAVVIHTAAQPSHDWASMPCCAKPWPSATSQRVSRSTNGSRFGVSP